ncbi:MAG: hypothetical protein H0V17_08060 [Deltaproteobacteria bacterium]|nr:hypothetical protein [Deltaproteobacteria bacterium]
MAGSELFTQPVEVLSEAFGMRAFKDRNETVLYLWDYFYCANAPRRADEKPWGVIERAMCRIRESEL